MRKEINSKSKRKWVAGGLAAFASVALLTTGFATWVVINNSTNKDSDISVIVDTAENTSVRMTFNVAGTLALKEYEQTVVESPKVIGTKNGEALAKDNPLALKISTFTIKFGSSVKAEDYTKLSFAIADKNNEEKNSADNKVASANNLLAEYRAKDSSFTYFDAPDALTVDLGNTGKLTEDATTGTKTWTSKDTILAFKWGSFFGGQSPVQYYNSGTFTKKEDALADIADKAVLELNKMYDQLNGKTITLQATLTK